jgi:hypothetical protein
MRGYDGESACVSHTVAGMTEKDYNDIFVITNSGLPRHFMPRNDRAIVF